MSKDDGIKSDDVGVIVKYANMFMPLIIVAILMLGRNNNTLMSPARGMARAFTAMFPIVLLVLAFILDDAEIGLLLIAVIISYLLNEGVKKLLSMTKTDNFKRPKGHGECKSFARDTTKTYTDNDRKTGMPSGHTQMAFFAAAYGTLHILHSKYGENMGTALKRHGRRAPKVIKDDQKFMVDSVGARDLGKIVTFFVLASLVGISRHTDGCHSWDQIIVGGAVGSGLGVASYIIINRILHKIFGGEKEKVKGKITPQLHADQEDKLYNAYSALMGIASEVEDPAEVPTDDSGATDDNQ